MTGQNAELGAVLSAHQWSHTATTHCACGFRTPLAQLAVDGYIAHVAEQVERIVAARLREQEDRVRQEFANIGAWKAGQSALISATGGDWAVIGSILSQVRRQVIDGYVEALRTPPGSLSGGES